MDKKMIRIEKLVPETLVLSFQNAIAYDSEKEFIIPAGRNHIILDIDYVVSMFQIPGTLALYKKGYFTFNKEDKEAVFEHARKLSLYYGEDDSGDAAEFEQPSVLYTERQINDALRLKRLNVIREIIEQGERPQQVALIEAARKVYGSLSVDIVKAIEEGLGIQLDDDLGDE